MFLRKAAELVITGWQERQSVHTQQNEDVPDLTPAEHHLAQAPEQQVKSFRSACHALRQSA
jgi:hypothetical protein